MVAWLGRNPFLLIAFSGLLLLSGLVAGDLMRSRDQPVLVVEGREISTTTPMRVHVAGAVVSPGVYEFAQGARVEEAVAAAGGVTADADMSSVNLARYLRDGEQILVANAKDPSPVVLQPGEPLDLNQATMEELDALPGIGEAYSRRIVDSRVVDGPFSSVEEVLERGLVPARTFEGIRSMVTVSPP